MNQTRQDPSMLQFAVWTHVPGHSTSRRNPGKSISLAELRKQHSKYEEEKVVVHKEGGRKEAEGERDRCGG